MSDAPVREKLWSDTDMLTLYKRAFAANPDVHLWAFLLWMRDSYEAHIAELTAQLAEVEQLRQQLEQARTENNNLSAKLATAAQITTWVDIDRLEAENKQLTQQLAERDEWEPVNTYVNQEILSFAGGGSIIINTNIQGRNITLYNSEGCEISILLRPDYAVCRRVPTKGEGDEGGA